MGVVVEGLVAGFGEVDEGVGGAEVLGGVGEGQGAARGCGDYVGAAELFECVNVGTVVYVGGGDRVGAAVAG